MRPLIALVIVLIASQFASAQYIDPADYDARMSKVEKRVSALEATVANLIKVEPVKATLPAPPQTPKPVKQIPSLVASSGPHWTYPGDITTHLTGTHGQNVNGLSIEQQLSLHDALHENRRVVAVTRNSAPVFQSNCPGGVCPTQGREVQATRYRIWRR